MLVPIFAAALVQGADPPAVTDAAAIAVASGSASDATTRNIPAARRDIR